MDLKTQRVKGISGSTLKIIAVVSMLIDHTAAVVINRALVYSYSDWLYTTAFVMRNLIGRMAFPIYCFLLVEGFEKTRNRMRYAGRLFLFALISEVPFDLAFKGRIMDSSYQNVFFTLFLGLLMIWAMEEIEKKNVTFLLKLFGFAMIFLAAAMLAEAISCDYRAKGIAAIALLFLFRKNKKEQIIAGCIAFLWEITAPLAFIFTAFYNGQRGWKMKYVFYIFYPFHLLALYFLSVMLFG